MIYLILLIALILRVINLDQSFWLDEAINVNVVKELGYRQLALDYSLGDFHPPLFHLILKVWTLIFPVSEVTTRMLSVLLGVGSVFVTYLIAKKLFEEKTALIASVLLATAPLHIYYSQEARMYMLAAFLASISVYFFVSLIKKENILLWMGFIISTATLLYSDYLPYLLLPTYVVYLAFFRKNIKKSTLLSFVPAFLLILFILIPWLSIFPKQLETGLSVAAASPTWAKVVGSTDLKDLIVAFVKFTVGRISYDNNLIYSLMFSPAAVFVSLMFLVSIFRMSVHRSFILFWFFIPIFLGFVISFFVPVFAYFRFIFILPAFYLIWASAINTVNVKKSVSTFLFIGLAINLVSLSIYYLNPKFQREDWKAATNYVIQNSTLSSIVLFESAHTVAPFDFYNQGKIDAAGALNGFVAKREYVENNIKMMTDSKDQIFLFQYLSGITDPGGILFEEITEAGFENIDTKDFAGVGFVYEFRR